MAVERIQVVINERAYCETVADGWMTDIKAHKALADVIERARADARNQALTEAATMVENLRPAGGPWTSLEAAAERIRALRVKP